MPAVEQYQFIKIASGVPVWLPEKKIPPPNQHGGLIHYAWSLIHFVNSWKRLAILIVLITFTIVAYLSYEHRRELAYSEMVAFGTPQIDGKTIKSEITHLMDNSGAISACVWSLNLEKNQGCAFSVREWERKLDNLVGTGDLTLRPYSQLTIEFISLIDNKTSCWKHVATTAVGKAARGSGGESGCAAAVPPQFGTMIGMQVIKFCVVTLVDHSQWLPLITCSGCIQLSGPIRSGAPILVISAPSRAGCI